MTVRMGGVPVLFQHDNVWFSAPVVFRSNDCMDAGGTTQGTGEVERRRKPKPRATHGAVAETQCAGNGLSPCQALQRRSEIPQERPKGWSVSIHDCVAYMDVGQGREQERKLCASYYINCEARLVLNADRPTELDIIMLKEY